MSGQIRMTPDTMRTRAGQYTTEAGKVQDVIITMDKLLNTLQTEWDGAAVQSYASRYAELKPNFLKAKQLIDEIAAALTSTANIVEQTDASIAQQFRG